MAKNQQLPKNIAKVGSTVSFKRNQRNIEGVVYHVNPNSVLVEISKEAQSYLGYENRNTVVSHRNYIIIEERQLQNA